METITLLLKIAGTFLLAFVWKRNKSTDRAPVIYFLLLLGVLGAALISSVIPPMTDRVMMTALGEKNENAQAESLQFHCFMVDGKEVFPQTSANGKWFRYGEDYCWRIESDPMQPKGVTRTVEFDVPVGRQRMVNFYGNAWTGVVLVATEHGSIVVDTWSEPEGMLSAEIGASASFKIIQSALRELAVYFGILILLSCIVRKLRYEWLVKHRATLIYAVIAAITMILMLAYSDRMSLWNDEIYRIGQAKQGVLKSLQSNLLMVDISPPLFGQFAALWYRITPYGAEWLFLPCILCCGVTVFLTGLVGKESGGEFCGVVATLLMAFSSTVWIYIAYEFSGYSLMLLFSASSLFFLIKKRKCGKRFAVLYGISLAALCMSHYFGMLACACYFIIDAVLVIRNEKDWKKISAYFIPGAISAVWLTAVYINTLQYRGPSEIAAWYPVPQLENVEYLLRFLSGNLEISFWLLLVGIGSGLTCLLTSSESARRGRYYGLFTCTILGSILVVFLYGKYVNTKATMWEPRYFTFLLPLVCLVSAYGLTGFCRCVAKEERQISLKRGIAAFFCILLSMNCVIAVKNANWPTQPYCEASHWLSLQINDIFASDTQIIFTTDSTAVEGWNDYYFSRKGLRDPMMNAVSQTQIGDSAKLSQYNKIYLQYSHMPVNTALQTFLNENFTVIEEHPEIEIAVYERKW